MSTVATSFDNFLIEMASSFRRIAYATKGEMTALDMQSEAWLMAIAVGDARGREIDFSDASDRQLIMARLYMKTVKRRDWNLFGAARIDEENDDGFTLADRLPAHEGSDPLNGLLAREAVLERVAMLENSYTQLCAYNRAYENFNFDLGDLRDHLVISTLALRRRIALATWSYDTQFSLWDLKAQIDRLFRPPAGKTLPARATHSHDGAAQQCWNF